MSNTMLGGVRSRKAALAVVVISWIAVITGMAVFLASSQSSARRGVTQRLAVRTSTGASFAAAYVRDLETREHQQATNWLTAPEVSQQNFGRVSRDLGFTAAVLLDRHGRLVRVVPAKPSLIGKNITGPYPHLAAAVAGRVAVSNVTSSAALGLPVVAFAVPFATSSGRRVFSGGFGVANTPLGAYLRDMIVTPGRRVYLVDAKGTVIDDTVGLGTAGKPLKQVAPALAASTQTGAVRPVASAHGQYAFVSAKVAGTPWRIAVAVPASALYVSVDGASRWVSWIAVICLALAGLVIIGLGARLLHSRERLAVLLIDIDHFKRVNDTYGHLAGDAVLFETAQALGSALRGEDAIGRWGGEEFIAVLPDTGAEGALTVAERLRERLAESRGEGEHEEATVTVTIGVAIWASGGIDDLLNRADSALYAGKRAGRNCVHVSADAAPDDPPQPAGASQPALPVELAGETGLDAPASTGVR
jgi:diguanylate cyclase (GGDEF)-like protein